MVRVQRDLHRSERGHRRERRTDRGRLTAGPAPGESGTSPVSALFGVAIFLAFLLLGVQVLLHLYTTSVVTSAAFEAARLRAGADSLGQDVAEERAVALLGGYGGRVSFDWTGSDTDQIVLRISGPTPARLIQAVGGLAGLDVIDRQVRVRVEAFRLEEP